jgi:hypothetical protein
MDERVRRSVYGLVNLLLAQRHGRFVGHDLAPIVGTLPINISKRSSRALLVADCHMLG